MMSDGLVRRNADALMQHDNRNCWGTDSGCHEGYLTGATISCCSGTPGALRRSETCRWVNPVVALAGRAKLEDRADRHLSVTGGPGDVAGAEVGSLVAGMVAGQDSIVDMGTCSAMVG